MLSESREQALQRMIDRANELEQMRLWEYDFRHL